MSLPDPAAEMGRPWGSQGGHRQVTGVKGETIPLVSLTRGSPSEGRWEGVCTGVGISLRFASLTLGLGCG